MHPWRVSIEVQTEKQSLYDSSYIGGLRLYRNPPAALAPSQPNMTSQERI